MPGNSLLGTSTNYDISGILKEGLKYHKINIIVHPRQLLGSRYLYFPGKVKSHDSLSRQFRVSLNTRARSIRKTEHRKEY